MQNTTQKPIHVLITSNQTPQNTLLAFWHISCWIFFLCINILKYISMYKLKKKSLLSLWCTRVRTGTWWQLADQEKELIQEKGRGKLEYRPNQEEGFHWFSKAAWGLFLLTVCPHSICYTEIKGTKRTGLETSRNVTLQLAENKTYMIS